MRYTITQFFRSFISNEKNAGLVLIACTGISLVLANGSFSESYLHLWHRQAGLPIPGLQLSVEQWINDGLMTIFFLMVGLEIERELYNGELHPIHKAILPIGGAIGGMLMPALLYLLLNYHAGTERGFGIPMGTDIAFALAVMTMAGKRVPASIKVILTAIAIIDDLGSVIIIALFYGSSIHLTSLLAALGIFGLLIVFNRLKLRSPLLYLLPGIAMWYFMMRSGIHPTIAGVLLAFAYPFGDGSDTAPSHRLQKILHLPVAFVILPLFTLANTAIPLKPEFISGLSQPHALGILTGLVLGKPLGITLAVWLMWELKVISVPKGIGLFDIASMGFIAGIGFTMSVFITQLAFEEELHIQSSKMMILLASCVAGLTGFLLFSLRRQRGKAD